MNVEKRGTLIHSRLTTTRRSKLTPTATLTESALGLGDDVQLPQVELLLVGQVSSF